MASIRANDDAKAENNFAIAPSDSCPIKMMNQSSVCNESLACKQRTEVRFATKVQFATQLWFSG
jgi:hypothetical protein